MGFRNYFFSSNRTGKKRGVAKLISNSVCFKLVSEHTHKEGRFVLVKGKLGHKEVTLCNFYAPQGRLDTTNRTRGDNTVEKLEELGLIDVWWLLHSLNPEFTFYSAIHNIYSRINYFLMFGKDCNKVKDWSKYDITFR